MDITIKTIPHAEQRYDTAGDYWRDDAGNLQIRVSAMGDRRFESLVAIHELAEALLCMARGISFETIDAFDKAFEAVRAPGNTDESGDDPVCPYRQEHHFATTVELAMAEQLGVDWAEYDKAVMAL